MSQEREGRGFILVGCYCVYYVSALLFYFIMSMGMSLNRIVPLHRVDPISSLVTR